MKSLVFSRSIHPDKFRSFISQPGISLALSLPLDMDEEKKSEQTPLPQPENQHGILPEASPDRSTLARLLAPFGKKRFKSGLLTFKNRWSQGFNKEKLQKRIQEFDPQKFMDWSTKAFQKRGIGFYGTLVALLLSTYFIADLLALIIGEYIPEPPISRSSRINAAQSRVKSISDYNPVFARNLFNSQGLIPGEEGIGSTTSTDLGGPPVKSSLPLNLIGTLVMSNAILSIATIEDKSSSLIYPVRTDDEIPGKAKILSIEPSRVVFVNVGTGRREYIELPEEFQNQNPKIIAGGTGGGIEKVSASQFNVSRSEVDKALGDFNSILTQARAVPNFDNGAPAGYKLFQIVPGSIYDKLGLQNGDIISGLNGNPINDPAKAFEMLSELKTANHLELQVKKDGKLSTFTYDIR